MVSHSLVIKAAGTSAVGNPAFSVYVNGVKLASDVDVSANYKAGQWNEFTFSYDSDKASDDIKIVYANDFTDKATNTDRNLFINTLSVDGKTFFAALADGANPHLGYQAGLTSAAFWSNGSLSVNTAQFRGDTPGQLKFLGIAYSGAEFSDNKLGDWNKAVSFPSDTNIDYYASKGLNTLRLPILWEQVQPVRGGPIDQAYVTQIKHVVEYAATKGITVVVDTHDFGQAYGELIGGSVVTNADFAAYWGTLALALKGSGNVIFGLMNEPNIQAPTEWLETANAAIAAIRATGATQTILVPGTAWDGAYNWLTTGNAATIGKGVVDPLNNYAFEVHQYIDIDSSGGSPVAVSANIGVERLQAITAWAEANGAKLFLGEFGVGSDATSLAALDKMLAYMEAHSGAWLGGTYWAAGNDNYFSIDPKDGGDRAQMDVLERYAPNEGTTYLPGNILYVSGNKTYYADGSIETRTFVEGELSRRVLDRTDGTKELYQYGVKNQAYTTDHTVLDAKGELISLDRQRADGTMVFTKAVNSATGAVTSSQYGDTGLLASQSIVFKNGDIETKTYAANGLTLLRDVVNHADGSKQATVYGITGQAYTTEHSVFDTKGNLLSIDRDRADGTLVFTKVVNDATGTVTSSQYGATGLLSSQSIVFKNGDVDTRTYAADGFTLLRDVMTTVDGSKDVRQYNITGQAHTIEHAIFNANGDLVLLDRQRANGTHVFTQVVNAATGAVTSNQFSATGILTSSSTAYKNGDVDSRTYAANGSTLLRYTMTHLDGSRDIHQYGITGQAYVKEFSVYDSKGALTTLDRQRADGTHVFTQVVNAATGAVTSNQFGTNGILATSTTTFKNGDVDFRNYAANGTTLSRYTLTHADGSRDVHQYGVTGQAYVTEYSKFNANGVMVSLDRQRADGTHVFTQVVNVSTGSVTTNQFGNSGLLTSSATTYRNGDVDTRIYAANGTTVSRHTVVHADGSKEVHQYGIAGQAYTVEHSTFDTKGTLVSLDRQRADGTHVFTQVVDAATGAVTTKQFGATGLVTTSTTVLKNGDVNTHSLAADGVTVLRETVVHADGSKEAWTYGITGQSYVTEHSVTDGAGNVTLFERARADGLTVFVKTVNAGTGATTVVTSDYATDGALASKITAHPDGTRITENFTAGVAENMAAGTLVGTVSATNAKQQASSYSLVDDAGGLFKIDAKTGAIVTTASLDYEQKSAYDVVVRVTSTGGVTSDQKVKIAIRNVDEAPTALTLDNATVREHLGAGAVVGTAHAIDPEGKALAYSIFGEEKLPFTIDALSGVISTTAELDHSVHDIYSLWIRVTDAGGHATDRAVTIDVLGPYDPTGHEVQPLAFWTADHGPIL